MQRGLDGEKLELWRRRMEEYEQGAETVAAFCQRVGVSAATFYLWRRRVAGETGETIGRKSVERSALPGSSGSVPPLSFLPIQVTGQSRRPIEVVLTGGTRVLVPSDDHQSLQMVLEVIRGLGLVSGARESSSC
jgi:hypothetical protein